MNAVGAGKLRRSVVLAVLVGVSLLVGAGFVAERGASGAAAAVVVAPFVEQGGMVPAGGAAGAGRGIALSADGNTLLTGGFVYRRSGSRWRQSAVAGGVNAPPVAALSADGHTAMVRRLLGGVSVFMASGSRWATGHVLHGPGAEFGTAIALSAGGNTALISAPSSGTSGVVWMFSRASSGWTRSATPITANPRGNDFGDVLALSADGKTAMIEEGGATVVFTRSGSTWTQRDKLNDLFLLSMSASGRSALLLSGQSRVKWAVAASPARWKIEPGPSLPGGRTPTNAVLSADGTTALLGFGHRRARRRRVGLHAIGLEVDPTRQQTRWPRPTVSRCGLCAVR